MTFQLRQQVPGLRSGGSPGRRRDRQRGVYGILIGRRAALLYARVERFLPKAFSRLRRDGFHLQGLADATDAARLPGVLDRSKESRGNF